LAPPPPSSGRRRLTLILGVGLGLGLIGVVAVATTMGDNDLRGAARLTPTTIAAAAPADEGTSDDGASAAVDDTDANFAALMALKYTDEMSDISNLSTDASAAINDGNVSQAADIAGQVAGKFHTLVGVTSQFDAPLAVETTGVFEQCETAWTDSATALNDFDPDQMSAAGEELGICGDSLTAMADRWG
jgi:hypothetical protein